MRKNVHNIITAIGTGVICFLLVGCQNDVVDDYQSAEGIRFGGLVCNNSGVSTRAYEGLDIRYITADPFNMDFYIRMLTTDENDREYSEISTYVIPSGYEGRLEAKEGANVLDWITLNKEHRFTSWNMTWVPEDNDPYTPDEDDLTEQVYFYNSEGDTGYDQYHNNDYLENFVGAYSGPFSYNQHGKYVDLTFYHLVSRIKIGSFVLVMPSGAIQEDLKADITFINMPKQATFNPVPSEGGRPVVTANPDAISEDDGVTYYISNQAIGNDIFYICPEVDFSTIDYKIELRSLDYKNYKTYYGTFDEVEFVRLPGYAHDQGGDSKTLHAGEEMTLNITLIPGVGPGLKVVIDQWSTDEPNEGLYHTYPGLYTDAELKQLRDLFLSMTQSNLDEKLEQLEELWELYGVEGENGEKYFMLYENMTLGTDNNIFPVWRDYILNGMGHTITARTNSGNYFGHGRNEAYFNTGPVRDIYFTSDDGRWTIYIDKDGYVWITDPETGELVQTENQLPELTGNNVGYDISAETGVVRLTTYFSPNLGDYKES